MEDPTSGPRVLAFDAVLGMTGRVLVRAATYRVRVIAYGFMGVALGVGVALLVPNQYTTGASFVAQGSTSLSLPAALQGAAASLGLDKGNDYSPKFYADLLLSRPVLRSVLLHPYHAPGQDSSQTQDYLQIMELADEASPAMALERGLKQLAGRIGASADVRTNMITLTVRTRYPWLSRDVAAQLLVALDSLNLGFRQFQSRESREFYETRVLQARKELDSAEAAVRIFLQENRVTASPALQFEQLRLQREADLKRSVYGIVVQQYEQARLQEARNVPTLTVLSEPFLPIKKSYPPRRLIVLLGLIVSLLVLWAQISIGEALARFRLEDPEQWATLQQQFPFIRLLTGRT